MIRRVIFLAVAGVLFAVMQVTAPSEPGPAGAGLLAASAVVALVVAWGLTGAFANRGGCRGRDDT